MFSGVLENGANVNSKVSGISILQLYINEKEEKSWKMVDTLTTKYYAESI